MYRRNLLVQISRDGGGREILLLSRKSTLQVLLAGNIALRVWHLILLKRKSFTTEFYSKEYDCIQLYMCGLITILL